MREKIKIKVWEEQIVSIEDNIHQNLIDYEDNNDGSIKYIKKILNNIIESLGIELIVSKLINRLGKKE